MAEAILKLVIEKLAGVAVRETLFLYGAESKLDSLQHELRWIQAFLNDAESKRKSNERVKTWVSEVRQVAYRIEDTIDMFIAEVDKHNRPGMVNALKRVLMNPKKLPIVHSLICEMDNIQTRLLEIKECAEKYGIIKKLGDRDSSSSFFRRPVILPDEDDPDVIGQDEDKENIVNLLLNPSIKERLIVSIVGQGGLGKTTLARKAYNSVKVKDEFEFRLWLSISQQFKLVDLLKTILEKIRDLKEDEKDLIKKEDAISQQRANEYFITKLNASLKNKHYLIIMDDVWTEDLWSQMKEALPDVKNGSRVLVTTRFSDIIRKANPTCIPYEYNLNYLSEQQSRELLLKKAFPAQDPETYPYDELSDLPEKFAIKCGFLPLALVVVGGLLSRKSPTYNCWDNVLKKFSWHDKDGKKCTEILESSYENLPIFLKPCFMYFALFPEDYEIKAQSLIQMWIAEGFIHEDDNKTMEEIAEDYLEELVQRSMIQVLKRSYNESIKYCGIHDLLRDVAIQKARENEFLEIITNRDGKCSSIFTRRLSLHCDCEDIVKYYPGPNLRSLFYFGDFLPNLAGYKLLKVLKAITYCRISTEQVFLQDLGQLRYLELEFNNNYRRSFRRDLVLYNFARQIFKNISFARNLQTLHYSYSRCLRGDQFDPLWSIKTLRHVTGLGGPPSAVELTNLQTLDWVRVRKEWITEGWPKLPNIRVLWLYEFTYRHWESFHTFLSGLHHLTSLHIATETDYNESLPPNCENGMIDMSVLPCYNSLQSLYVGGKWTASKVTASSFPIHLIELTLEFSRIQEDPMPVLEKLASLKVLKLLSAAYEGRKLCCSAGGFPRLQILEFSNLWHLMEWTAEEGAMPMLKEVNILWCVNLQTIPSMVRKIGIETGLGQSRG